MPNIERLTAARNVDALIETLDWEWPSEIRPPRRDQVRVSRDDLRASAARGLGDLVAARRVKATRLPAVVEALGRKADGGTVEAVGAVRALGNNLTALPPELRGTALAALELVGWSTRDRGGEVYEAAAEVLAEYGARDAVPALIGLVRHAKIGEKSLGRRPDRASLDAWRDATAHRHSLAVASAALATILRLDGAAAHAVVALKWSEPGACRQLIDAVDHPDRLLALLEHEDAALRLVAIGLLAGADRPDDRVVAIASAVLRADGPGDREPGAVPVSDERAWMPSDDRRDQSGLLWRAAAGRLASTGHPGLAALQEALLDAHPGVHAAVAEAVSDPTRFPGPLTDQQNLAWTLATRGTGEAAGFGEAAVPLLLAHGADDDGDKTAYRTLVTLVRDVPQTHGDAAAPALVRILAATYAPWLRQIDRVTWPATRGRDALSLDDVRKQCVATMLEVLDRGDPATVVPAQPLVAVLDGGRPDEMLVRALIAIGDEHLLRRLVDAIRGLVPQQSGWYSFPPRDGVPGLITETAGRLQRLVSRVPTEDLVDLAGIPESVTLSGHTPDEEDGYGRIAGRDWKSTYDFSAVVDIARQELRRRGETAPTPPEPRQDR